MEKIRLVAEIAQAHDGSLGMAHSLIESSAKAGATDIKFQMHYAKEESTSRDRFRVNSFPQDKTRYDYWERIEFTKEEWSKLFTHCRNLGLNIIVSPFSHFAVDICNSLGIKSFKLGSGETTNAPLIRHTGESASEIILSTGMSSWNEISDAHKVAKLVCEKIYILQCTSKYPCSLQEIGVNCIKDIVTKFTVKSGLSDHSGKLSPSIVAAVEGYTSMIEVHVTHSKESFGPDTKSSLDFNDFNLLSSLIKEIEIIKDNSINKDIFSDQFVEMRNLFGRSIVANKAISIGELITKDMLCYKKPGGGLSYKEINKILGKKVTINIEKDEIITLKKLV